MPSTEGLGERVADGRSEASCELPRVVRVTAWIRQIRHALLVGYSFSARAWLAEAE